MSQVTIPTIDQISGDTVMQKLRSLIKSYITFGGEVDTKLQEFYDALDAETIESITSSASGSTITCTMHFKDGSTKSFSFEVPVGVTLDTIQTITGEKTFTDVNVDGTLTANGDVVLRDNTEIAGASVVRSGQDVIVTIPHSGSTIGRLIIKVNDSNELIVGNGNIIADAINSNGVINIRHATNRGIYFQLADGTTLKGYITVNANGDMWIKSSDGDITLENPTDGKFAKCKTPTSDAGSTAIVNKSFVQDTSGISNIAHSNQANIFSQYQTIVGSNGTDGIISKSSVIIGSTTIYNPSIRFNDANDVTLGFLRTVTDTAGKALLQVRLRNADGTTRDVYLG